MAGAYRLTGGNGEERAYAGAYSCRPGQEILDLIAALSEHFRLDPQTCISGNLMCYYEEGNPAAVFSPDVFVVRGISNQQRRSYKLWEECQMPLMVIEVTSRSTRLEDQGTKRALYALLGVEEQKNRGTEMQRHGASVPLFFCSSKVRPAVVPGSQAQQRGEAVRGAGRLRQAHGQG